MDFLDNDWTDIYDPDYPIDGGKYNDESNEPVDPDAWADEDINGGF